MRHDTQKVVSLILYATKPRVSFIKAFILHYTYLFNLGMI